MRARVESLTVKTRVRVEVLFIYFPSTMASANLLVTRSIEIPAIHSSTAT